MKQYIMLISALTLTACGGGSGGGHGDGLTPAEHFFGAGIGTGSVPSHLVAREDGAGFEILSFGAWGNVYDIKQTNNEYITFLHNRVALPNPNRVQVYEFLGQQKLDIDQNYNYLRDASVANAVFTGPAIMYEYKGYYDYDSDYGTMKLHFGQDIDSNVVEFVMNNPDNNLTVNNVGAFFTEDRNNVAINYDVAQKTYIGYGSKN